MPYSLEGGKTYGLSSKRGTKRVFVIRDAQGKELKRYTGNCVFKAPEEASYAEVEGGAAGSMIDWMPPSQN